jgi:hypothetical protein
VKWFKIRFTKRGGNSRKRENVDDFIFFDLLSRKNFKANSKDFNKKDSMIVATTP